MQTDNAQQLNETQLPVMIPIDLIDMDPNQPRKTCNEQGIKELAQSIRQKGILQNLIVRPKNDRYLIVAGHRRYQAALTAELKEVPAVAMDVSDKEALEIQILENLQREDVHFMEEAAGFKMLIEQGEADPLEIANRLGKSVFYVRQRLQLNNLTPKWQTMFRKNGITLTMALDICIFPEAVQQEIYKNHVDKEDEKSPHPFISINSYALGRYNGDLTSASFDISDKELDKQCGACTSCPFNSALNSLFPEQEKHPTCNNIKCFIRKTELHLQRELAKAKEDPSVALVYESNTVPDIVKSLEEEGLQVLRAGYGEECKTIQQPVKPDWPSFQKREKKFKKPDKEIKADFKTAEENFEHLNQLFEKGLATGTIIKGFMVDSYGDKNTGKYVYVELTPKDKPGTAKKAIENGTATPEDYDKAIEDKKQRELRNKELDQEKVQKRIAETVRTDTSLDTVPQRSTAADTTLMYFLVLEHLSYNTRDKAQKIIRSAGLWNPKSLAQFQKALQSLTKTQMTYLLRQIITDKYASNLPNTKGGFMFRLMAENLGTVPIADFEKEQNEKAKTREANSNKAIAVLKELKKEQLATIKPASKQDKTTKKPQKVRA